MSLYVSEQSHSVVCLQELHCHAMLCTILQKYVSHSLLTRNAYGYTRLLQKNHKEITSRKTKNHKNIKKNNITESQRITKNANGAGRMMLCMREHLGPLCVTMPVH